MPIYAYRCADCGHSKDVLQKLSDPALTTCPSCGAQAFAKQVTAAGFQLKGSGWYVTDFRGNGAAAKSADKAEAGKGDAAKTDAPAAATAAAGSSSSAASADSGSSSGGACGGSCACH